MGYFLKDTRIQWIIIGFFLNFILNNKSNILNKTSILPLQTLIEYSMEMC